MALVTARYDLDLPDGDLDPLLAGLEAEAAGTPPVNLLTWWDVPDAWVDERASLSERMANDAPLVTWTSRRRPGTPSGCGDRLVARARWRHVVETVAAALGERAGPDAFTATGGSLSRPPDVVDQLEQYMARRSEYCGDGLDQLVKANETVRRRALRSGLCLWRVGGDLER